MEFAFYFAAGVAVLATLRVITNSNPVHALLYLIISLLAISMTFFSLGAPFAGALEIIVYAGAIMVLFVFVVMMLNLGPAVVEQERKWLTPGIWVGPSALALVLLGMVRQDFSAGEVAVVMLLPDDETPLAQRTERSANGARVSSPVSASPPAKAA